MDLARQQSSHAVDVVDAVCDVGSEDDGRRCDGRPQLTRSRATGELVQDPREQSHRQRTDRLQRRVYRREDLQTRHSPRRLMISVI